MRSYTSRRASEKKRRLILNDTKRNQNQNQNLFVLVCKLKILRALEKKFVPTLGGLLFETKLGKYIVTPTSKKKFSTRNPAVFF